MSRAAPAASLHTLAVTAFRLRELGIAVALLAAIVFFAVRSDAFFTSSNWQDIALNVATVVVVAVGQTMVVLTRNIDLSVGSIVGLSAFVSADTLSAHNGLPIAVMAVLAVAVGLGCGVFNGLLVTVGQVPAIIATLGTLYVYRGLVHQVSGGSQVLAFELPSSFKTFAVRDVLGIPALAVIAIVVAALGAAVLRWTHWGRDFYAIGSNPEAARYSGIPVGRRVLLAFAISGALAGLGGFMYAARFANVSAASGSGFEFDVISAVVIGGVNVFGGVGTVLGAVLGRSLHRRDRQRLHAPQDQPVLEDRLPGLCDRRRGDDRRARHPAPPGGAAAAAPARGSCGGAGGGFGVNAGRAGALARSLVGRWEFVLVLLILAAGIWSAALSPFFLDVENLLDLMKAYIVIGLMALGLTLVVVAGEIDISVASTLAVCVVVFADVWQSGVEPLARLPPRARRRHRARPLQRDPRGPAPPPLAGGDARHARRLPRARVRDPRRRRHHGLPGELHAARKRQRGVEPLPGLARDLHRRPPRSSRCCCTEHGSAATSTRSARTAKPRASREFPVDRVRVTIFAVSGLMAAAAGLLYASYFATAQADAATFALLDVVAAVVLGGVNIFGGSGTIPGVFLAVVLIAVLRNGMGLANIPGDTQSIVIGGLLLGAILVGEPAPRRPRAGPRQAPRRPSRAKGGPQASNVAGVRANQSEENDERSQAMRRSKDVITILALLVLAMVLRRRRRAAAGDDDGGGARTAGSLLYMIPKNVGNPVFDLTNAGMKAAADGARGHDRVQRLDRGRRATAGRGDQHRGRAESRTPCSSRRTTRTRSCRRSTRRRRTGSRRSPSIRT